MFGLRWAQKTKPCFVTLRTFSARLPVKVFKTLNGRQSYILSKLHKSKKIQPFWTIISRDPDQSLYALVPFWSWNTLQHYLVDVMMKQARLQKGTNTRRDFSRQFSAEAAWKVKMLWRQTSPVTPCFGQKIVTNIQRLETNKNMI